MENRNTTLETGDNPALTRTLLDRTVTALTKTFHHTVIARVTDKVGAFSYKLRDPNGDKYYLIAKGSRLYKDLISTQAGMPNRADTEKVPIILVWKTENQEKPEENEPKFYLYNPRKILKENYGVNERYGVLFVNWAISQGFRWIPPMNIGELFEKSKQEQSDIKRFF